MQEMRFPSRPAQKQPLARPKKLREGQSIRSISSTYFHSPFDGIFEIYPAYPIEWNLFTTNRVPGQSFFKIDQSFQNHPQQDRSVDFSQGIEYFFSRFMTFEMLFLKAIWAPFLTWLARSTAS
jgi:hypothetical protein